MDEVNEQLAVLYLDKVDQVWELVTDQEDDRTREWEVEADAISELKAEGWEFEGPFTMSPDFPDLPEVKVWGYTLRRKVQ